MRYSQLHQLVLANFAISNKLVPNVIGEPGGGKSTLARHIIRDLGIKKERIVEFNPSLHDPTDILGLPNNTGEYSRWVPPEEFYRIRDDGTDEPCALLLEEISDAIMAMQNPLCRLILDRHAGMMPLHPKLYIIATGNETKHKSGANRLATKLSSARCLSVTERTVSSSTRCALARLAHASSSPCTCSCPASGPSTAAMTCWSGLRPTSATRCRERPSSRTLNRWRIPLRGTNKRWSARSRRIRLPPRADQTPNGNEPSDHDPGPRLR